MQLTTALKQIGFNEKEAKIYIALLKLGEANIQNIADKAGIPRTSIYTPLKSLIQKGGAEFYKRKGRNYYTAATPEKVLSTAKRNTNIFAENLKYFHDLESASNKPDIRFFEGSEGIKLLFNEVLAEQRPFMAITCIEDMNKIASEYFEDFMGKRVEQRLRVRLLTNKWKDAIDLKNSDDISFRETRFVPEKYKFNTANYIFGDKIAMLSLKDEPVIGVLIHDKDITDTHKMYFELMWDIAEK